LRSLLWLPIALGLLLVFPHDPAVPASALQHDREVTFVYGMIELLPVGVLGLMLTAMLAALASTLDTHLNWGASYWTNDLYKRLVCQAWLGREPDERTLVWVARSSNLVILALALVVMTQLTSIDRAWRIALLLGAGLGPLLVLRWLWWRISAWGELACIAMSLAAAGPLLAGVEGEAARLLAMALLATGAGIGVSLLTPEDPEHLRIFFERVRPPGWWGPVAASLGLEPREGVRRLARATGATLAAAVCALSLLTGLGAWLCQSPEPTWWPLSWGVWIAAQIGVALAAVPVWLRLGFAGDTGSSPLP